MRSWRRSSRESVVGMLTKDPKAIPDKWGKRPSDRTIGELLQGGVIILDKPSGPTSHQATAWVRDALKCEKASMPEKALTEACTAGLCNLVYGIPDGVIRMSDSMPGLVETSTNMAIVKTEGDDVVISCLLRSSVDTAKYDLAAAMQAVVDLAGASAEFTGAYPGWKPDMDSPILKVMQERYRALFGSEAKVMAIHAGLECGLLGGVYKNWDMISFGPTIKHPHSPDEKVNIESVGKFWKYLTDTLEHIPQK